MNRFEEELSRLNSSITVIKVFLLSKKNMDYETWTGMHNCLDDLEARRKELLLELKTW